MGLKRCDQGHYFDASQHTSCPHCGIADLTGGATKPAAAINLAEPVGAGSSGPTKPAPPNSPFGNPNLGGGGRNPGGGTIQGGRGAVGGDGAKTIGIFQKKMGVDPVVGWLVCIEGADRGRDYRIRSGRNFIGRDEKMDIWIKGDDGISRERHAIISYDPKSGRFKLLPGDSTGLTYLNDDTVDVPVELKPFDTIELGATKLKFVPFCGEEFRWSTEAEGAEA